MRSQVNHSGFTLVELSIVLVIIGFLAAGILVGRDLINAAEIRGTISQIEQYKTAVNTFRSKYNCLPGDCAQASQYELGGINGNGNGFLDSCINCNNGVTVQETVYFWEHLFNANLISENRVTYASISPGSSLPPFIAPKAKMANAVFVPVINTFEYNRGPAYWAIAKDKAGGCYVVPNVGQDIICPSNALTALLAYGLDSKVDDGLPTTGTTISGGDIHASLGLIISMAPPELSLCIDSTVTPPIYNIKANGTSCLPVIKFM